MKFVNYKIHASCDDVKNAIFDSTSICSQEKFETSKGNLKFHIKEKNHRYRIKCEYIGGATKDNAFLEGTYFIGELSQKNEEAILRGIIVTAPIYHLIIALLLAFFVAQCIIKGGFTPVPLILFFFSIFMFKDEFKKQGMIKKYIFRAFKNTFLKLNPDIDKKIQ